MNTKAVMAIILAIASAAGIVAVAEAQDVEADENSWVDLGSESIGYGYTPTEGAGGNEYKPFDATFVALNSEQAYVNETRYTATWTVKDHGTNDVSSSGDGLPTWTFTYSHESPDETPVTLTSSATPKSPKLAVSIVRDDVGKYSITVGVADNTQIADVKGTHNLEVTVQFSLKVGQNEDDVLDLNTVHYKASLEVYDNRLDSMTVNDFFVNTNSPGNQIKFPSDSDDTDGLSITTDRYDRYVWYAVGLPDGLTITDGVISGMPVESTKQNGENDPAEVLIVVRGTQSSPTNVSETEGREYYGTLSINVWESVAESYTIELTEADTTADSDKKLFGSDDSYVAVNGAKIQLKITGGSKAFDGQVTVIDAETGIRSAVTGITSGTIVTYSNIPLSGVGT